jgi:putative endonuclease
MRVGVTNDVVRRYEQHSSGWNPKCCTHLRRPLRLIYAGEFSRVQDAIAFEKQLKGWSHNKKRAFAERDWPLLKRLAIGPTGAERASAGEGAPPAPTLPPLSSQAESRDRRNVRESRPFHARDPDAAA